MKIASAFAAIAMVAASLASPSIALARTRVVALARTRVVASTPAERWMNRWIGNDAGATASKADAPAD